MGVFILLIIILGFAAGFMRRELALMLTSAVFLALWVYCLVMTLVLALIHFRRARNAGIRVIPREVITGASAEAVYSEGEASAFNGRIVQLPGIVVRCRLLLAAKDGRCIRHDFNPGGKSAASVISTQPAGVFTVKKRGAYFSTYDEFAIFDILGFFRFAYRLPSESGARLLASPRAADEAPAVSARAGESMLKPEFSFQRSDNLIDHRPYVPGDDPRRINWKLYGHGGGLFVREGEFEPPPQSNIIILIDTGYDPLLYRVETARNGIDLLCENALAAALACAESGMEVSIGYSGGTIRAGNSAELASVLAWPAASPLSASLELSAASNDSGVLILALPRSSAETSSLDRFLNDAAHRAAGNNNIRIIELLFLYDDAAASGEFLSAAETCVSLYNRRQGVKAKAIGVENGVRQ
jgi:uncharacterized protein (DUF58 family)